MNPICWLWDHKWTGIVDTIEWQLDYVCERCGAPEWELTYGPRIAYRLRRLVYELKHRFPSWKCPDCGRWYMLLGKSVGKHEDCLPF